ncbi:MAG TPA: hypothetical protein V6C52_08880 [Coleofasciculaceae cyanobacterium]|jgi:hypothetical protein
MLPLVTRFPQRLAAQWREEFPILPLSRETVLRLSSGDWRHFWRNLLLIPVFPVLGYYGLDQSGVSDFLVSHGLMIREILGEGFGHVGLCFSLHYVMNAAGALYKACRG